MTPIPTPEPREAMKRLVRTIVDALVSDPEHVMVFARTEGNGVSVHIVAPEEELGRLIGRNGQTAKALRTLVTAAGVQQGVSCYVSAGPYAQVSEGAANS